MLRKYRSLRLAITCAENDELDRGPRRSKCLRERVSGDELSTAIRPLKKQPMLLTVLVNARFASDIATSLRSRILTNRVLAAVTAEVNHRWLELA